MNKLLVFLLSFSLSGLTFSQTCYEASITSPTPFMGNNDEIFKLSDGSLWEVKYEYEYLYEYYPDIIICPSRGKLLINGKTLNVQSIGRKPPGGTKPQQTDDIIETQIEGEFKGWDGETIFKLTNGQIWQQSSYSYTYSYKYRPSVIIFKSGGGFKLQVEGMGQRISVIRLK